MSMPSSIWLGLMASIAAVTVASTPAFNARTIRCRCWI